MSKILSQFLLFSLLLSSCRLSATPLKSKPTKPPFHLEPCTVLGVDAECGTFCIPDDRNNPSGRVLDLKIVVVRAYGSNRQPDPLFYIVSGPGVAVTSPNMVANAHNYIFRSVNAQRDLVFLDQRGTNDKHRLTCAWPPITIIDATQEKVDDWMKQCLADLDELFAYCDQDEECHAAYPDIRSDLKAVLDRLANGPVITSYQPAGASKPASLSLTDVESGLYQLLYSGNYNQIPCIIHTLATNDDWTKFVKDYSQSHPVSPVEEEPFLFMQYMIDCFETAEGFNLGATAGPRNDSFYQDVFINSAQINKKICTALPKPDPSLIYGPGRIAPLSALMFNSLLDPIFPPSSMDLALKEFTESRMLVEQTEGHEPFIERQCRWDIMSQYIEQGSVDGLDTSCLEKIKPSFVIGD